MTGSIRIVLTACIMTFAGGTLQADVLELADGSRIVGTLETLAGDEAVLSGTFAGRLTVPRSAIVAITTEAPVTVQDADGQYLTGRLESRQAGKEMILTRKAGRRAVPLADLQGVYREHPLVVQQRAAAVEVSAAATVGVTLTSGNSETENLHVDGQVVARKRQNRYTVQGEYTQEKSFDALVKRNWGSLVKYDNFVSDRWFWFTSATFESDGFADLDLRSALAAGMGYQFFDSERRTLSVEAGPSYVHENFDVAANDSYVGGRWALNYEQRLWDDFTFYHFNEALLSVHDTGNLTVRSRTGVRMSLTDHVIARVQTAVDWNNSPPENTDSTDFEHTLTVGYAF